MDELRHALKNISNTLDTKDTIGLSGYATSGELSDIYGSLNPGAISGSIYNNTVVGGGYASVTGLGNLTTNGAGYTLNSGAGLTYTNATISANPWWGANTSTNISGKLEINGDNADVVINGVSLMEILRDRLNVMIPNPEMEKEWDQLKELGDQYRALEAKLKEQAEMWRKLKEMPPPDPLY